VKNQSLALYHGACYDGTGAALAALMRFGADGADYVPLTHGAVDLPAVLDAAQGKAVYMLDFSLPRDQMDALADISDSFCLIDHHKTAAENLAGWTHPKVGAIVLDMEHSGAVLAWKFFHPGVPVPELLRFIEDRDLWRFQMPETRVIHGGLYLLGYDPLKWEKMLRDWADDPTPGTYADGWRRRLLEEGSAVVKAKEVERDLVAKFAYRTVIAGSVPAVAVNFAAQQSALGNMMANLAPPNGIGIVWWYDGEVGLFRVSLRSVGVDVSAIARRWGGGGHHHAAGFTCEALPFKPGIEA